MGLDIITTGSFSNGVSKIAINTATAANLQYFIDLYSEKYIKELLGVDLYNLFVADLVAGVPQTPIYLDIYNPISFQEGEIIYSSRGMIEMLKGFVNFHYVRDRQTAETTGGKKLTMSDNSVNVSLFTSAVNLVHNESINDYKVIQEYIERNISDYQTYEGIKAHFSLGL